jgi:hypothetical protein
MYLAFDKFRRDPCDTIEQLESRLAANAFYGYAARYWAAHLSSIKSQTIPEATVCDFLLNQGSVASARQATLTSKHEAQTKEHE